MKSPLESDAAGRDETRRQLLEAAGGVFAEEGFRNATVREICHRAGANIAAVNYHFGDKETLYAEVLRYAHGKALEKYPPLLGLSADAPPEKKLRAFVLSFLLRIFDKGRAAWHGQLMSREMIEPTAALDSLVAERMRPMADQLRRHCRGNSRLPAERRARAALRHERGEPVRVLPPLPPCRVAPVSEPPAAGRRRH